MEATVQTIGVIGTGVMGRGIMQWAAQSGATVLAYDARETAAAAAVASVADVLARSVARGRLSEAQRGAMLGRTRVAGAIAELAQADLVIEAIVEELDAKRQLFAELERIVGDDAILCTNTSSLSVTACARDCSRPGRIAGLHFFNPVPLMKVVEVIPGERTRADVVERILETVRRGEHRPLVCSDTPGFVVNHAGRGLSTEALRIVQEGVATPVDVDRVMREYGGLPMGPFELLDLTGLDVSGRVLREIYEGFLHEPRYRPSPLVFRRMDARLYGRKVGEGFYRYDNGKKVEPAELPAPPVSAVRTYAAAPDTLRDALRRGGLNLVADPADADVILTCPFGDDATTTAVSAGHDPRKVVAVDTLFAERLTEGGRATLMTTPVTARESADAVHAALAGAGLRVTRIADSPGFIAQRIFANIVNTACEIAQQRIAAPDDIEAGVRLGLGYPEGPLAIGDRIGRRRVLHILERLQSITGDPRYRPSLWLRRRALLDMSLTTPE
jgi:3-hydroxybutyryl-CoA dehydrogenase